MSDKLTTNERVRKTTHVVSALIIIMLVAALFTACTSAPTAAIPEPTERLIISTPTPTAVPTPMPTPEPTPEPTIEPTPEPTEPPFVAAMRIDIGLQKSLYCSYEPDTDEFLFWNGMEYQADPHLNAKAMPKETTQTQLVYEFSNPELLDVDEEGNLVLTGTPSETGDIVTMHITVADNPEIKKDFDITVTYMGFSEPVYDAESKAWWEYTLINYNTSIGNEEWNINTTIPYAV